jgi:hypothetical protein
MRFALVPLVTFLACGPSPAGTATPEPAGCNAVRETGRLVRGREIEVLRRALRAGDRLSVQLECEPADAVVLELEGPLRGDGAAEGTGPGPTVWTEFPRPLPPGVERCPADGCGDGGTAWLSPRLERRVTAEGVYVLRLSAPERSATCAVCVDVGTAE